MLHESKQHCKISPDVRHRALGEEGIVLRQKSGDVLVINEIASRILEGVGKGLDVSSISEGIYQDYEVEREKLASDVGVLLDEFESLGIIEYLQK